MALWRLMLEMDVEGDDPDDAMANARTAYMRDQSLASVHIAQLSGAEVGPCIPLDHEGTLLDTEKALLVASAVTAAPAAFRP